MSCKLGEAVGRGAGHSAAGRGGAVAISRPISSPPCAGKRWAAGRGTRPRGGAANGVRCGGGAGRWEVAFFFLFFHVRSCRTFLRRKRRAPEQPSRKMSNNNLAKNLASEVGDLTRVPTDADDHLKLLAARCEAKDFLADFDAEYLTVPIIQRSCGAADGRLPHCGGLEEDPCPVKTQSRCVKSRRRRVDAVAFVW